LNSAPNLCKLRPPAHRKTQEAPVSLSLYQASVPAFATGLTALAAVLDKAAQHAEARKFDSAIFLSMRLRPDMFTFAGQVQSACDQAKFGSGRLAGGEIPRFQDKEASLAELKARIEATLAYLKSLDAKAIDAAADREIVFPVGSNMKMKMKGADYLFHFVLPNFYFHLTTAYGILRFSGVEIGKRDFLGQIPGISPA
jgi:uncharacterized protein